MGKTSSSVYNINYHFVWCPKYRKQILKKEIKLTSKTIKEKITMILGCFSGWCPLCLALIIPIIAIFRGTRKKNT